MNYNQIKQTYNQKVIGVKNNIEHLKQQLESLKLKDTQNIEKITRLETKINLLQSPIIEETKVETDPKKKVYRQFFDTFYDIFNEGDKEKFKGDKEKFIVEVLRFEPLKRLNFLGNDEEDKIAFQEFMKKKYINKANHKQFTDTFYENITSITKPIEKKLDEKSIFTKNIDITFVKKPQALKETFTRVIHQNLEETVEKEDDKNIKNIDNNIKNNYINLIKIFKRSSYLDLWNKLMTNQTISDEVLENIDFNSILQQLSDIERIDDEKVDVFLKYVSKLENEVLKNKYLEHFIIVKVVHQNLKGKDVTLEQYLSKKKKKTDLDDFFKKMSYLLKAREGFIKNILLEDKTSNLLIYIRTYLIAQGKNEKNMLSPQETIKLFNNSYHKDFLEQMIKVKLINDEEYFKNEFWTDIELTNFEGQKNEFDKKKIFLKSGRRNEKQDKEKEQEKIENEYYKLEEKDFGDFDFEKMKTITDSFDTNLEKLKNGFSLKNMEEIKNFFKELDELLTKKLLPEYKKITRVDGIKHTYKKIKTKSLRIKKSRKNKRSQYSRRVKKSLKGKTTSKHKKF